MVEPTVAYFFVALNDGIEGAGLILKGRPFQSLCSDCKRVVTSGDESISGKVKRHELMDLRGLVGQ